MKQIYTDGACKGNPGKGGWAFIILEDNKELIKNTGHQTQTTNQRMEMKAVIESLKHIKQDESAEIFSDSAYVVNCFLDNWMVNWKKNNWIASNKKPVANKDLWEEIDNLMQNKSITFNKVKGHSNNEINNKVDKMASEAALKN